MRHNCFTALFTKFKLHSFVSSLAVRRKCSERTTLFFSEPSEQMRSIYSPSFVTGIDVDDGNQNVPAEFFCKLALYILVFLDSVVAICKKWVQRDVNFSEHCEN